MLEAMPNSAELTGWLTYLRVDDEVQAQRTAYAIAKAFGAGEQKVHANNRKQPVVEEEEEIIDTTDPDFVKHFQGFTYGDKPKNIPQQSNEIEIIEG
jgi:hypothetical protein